MKKSRTVAKIEKWIHDHSIAIVVRYTDGTGLVQKFTAKPEKPLSDINYVNMAGMAWIAHPVMVHNQVQNSRRYAVRNLH